MLAVSAARNAAGYVRAVNFVMGICDEIVVLDSAENISGDATGACRHRVSRHALFGQGDQHKR